MQVLGRRTGIGSCVAFVCLGVLSVLRALDEEWVWAAVFAFAAASQVWLALTRDPKDGQRPEGPSDHLDRATAERSGADPARQLRTWKIMTLSATALSVGVLWWSDPALAPIAALITIACLIGWLRAARRTPLTTPKRQP